MVMRDDNIDRNCLSLREGITCLSIPRSFVLSVASRKGLAIMVSRIARTTRLLKWLRLQEIATCLTITRIGRVVVTPAIRDDK